MVTKWTTLGVLAALLLLAPVFASGAQALPASGGLGVKAPGLVTQVRSGPGGGGRGFAMGGMGGGRVMASPGGGMRGGAIGGGRAFYGPGAGRAFVGPGGGRAFVGPRGGRAFVGPRGGRAYVGPGNVGRGAYIRPGGPGQRWAKGVRNGPRVAGWRGYGYNKYHNKYKFRRFAAYPFFYGYPYYAYSYGAYGGCYWLRERAIRTGDPYWWRRYRDCRNWD